MPKDFFRNSAVIERGWAVVKYSSWLILVFIYFHSLQQERTPLFLIFFDFKYLCSLIFSNFEFVFHFALFQIDDFSAHQRIVDYQSVEKMQILQSVENFQISNATKFSRLWIFTAIEIFSWSGPIHIFSSRIGMIKSLMPMFWLWQFINVCVSSNIDSLRIVLKRLKNG